LVVGNWKMNLDRAGSEALAAGVARQADDFPDVDFVVCPPSVYLSSVVEAVAGSRVEVGAQNMYHEPSGAYTGEISAAMLCDLDVRHVIVGHSERRHILRESDADVNKKTRAALDAGLTPIVCVGELLAERKAGRTREIIHRQFGGSLAGLSAADIRKVVIAYEPVWAIGTGEVATPERAEEVHAELRGLLADRYNAGQTDMVRILYGGSVKPENAKELICRPNVDGLLVGGASLKLEQFMGIAAAATNA
jgi:triosephosphate isomerase